MKNKKLRVLSISVLACLLLLTMIGVSGFAAVSYTHLDVYKRQEVIPFFLSGDNLFPADQLAGRPILRIDLHVAGHAVSRRAGHDAEMHGLAGIDKG